VDALGNPVGFHLTGGQAHDLVGADALLPELEAETLIADKAFDADERVLEPLAEAGKTAVIPPRKTRKTPRAFAKTCRERVKMSGLRSTSNVRSDAVAGLWAGWGEQGSSTPSTGFAAERTYAAVCTRRIGSIRVPSAS
jgi:IS5 family transposase